jgi:hypothetical protein
MATFERGRMKPNGTNIWVRFVTNIGTAIIGGLFLIGYMLNMRLHKSLTTSLVTVSVAGILFAPLLVVGSECVGKGASQFVLLGGTAAYAAVLVVFVGKTNS